MKKRMLALALALTMIVGLGGQAWAEVLPDLVSPSPEVSAQPENSASPEGTEAPQETTAPEETDAPEESAAPEETTVPEESETPEEPVETPILDEAYALPGVENFAVTEAAPRAGSYTEVDGLEDVVGTTINVFDYWLVNQTTADDTNNEILPNGGINAGHVLLFGKGMSGAQNAESYAAKDGADKNGETDWNPVDGATFNNNGYWNGWSGVGSGPVNGIVSKTLGTDGFPRLALNTSSGLASQWVRASSLNSRNRTESLAYLFDPDQSHGGKQSYTNVGGLLRVDDQGYYYYDSQGAFASLLDGMTEEQYRNGADGVNFKLYTSNMYSDTTGGVNAAGNSPNGQFFPFNSVDSVFGGGTVASNDSSINHYFGMHMQSRFVQQYEGHTDSSKQDVVTYEFSGDDDVWIFIDDVLVADLGGIHDAVSVKIEFDTGRVTISSASKAKDAQGRPKVFGSYSTTLKDLFEEAGKSTRAFNGNTFADDTYHTLDFFYLERGNTDSNMNLKYNLVTVPESSIIKVDQTGNPVPGVTFELYTANQNYDEQAKIASGTTDENGQFVLVDDDGYIVSLQDVWMKMEQSRLIYTDGSQQRGNLILKETGPLEGYRSAGDVQLYLVESNEHVLMLSENHWDTGAYAYVNSTISMNGEVSHNGGTANLDDENAGILFAVVLRRTSNVGSGEPAANDNWGLMTGSATEGWHTGAALSSGQDGVQELLEQLQAVSDDKNYFVAQPDSSGAYKVTVSDLPGDIMTYFYMLDETNKKDTEFTVAFYYTTARNVASANERNTWRVTNSNDWERDFSADVHVPNIKNRIFVQKLDPNGTAIAGAEFTLYRNAECTDKVGTLTTMNLNKEQHGIQLNGAGVYPIGDAVLANDTYYLKETAAPDGYAVNPKVTKIVVDNTGVYADAGEANDGIVVARGVGSIVKSMAQFASLGDIDVTLNNIVAKFYTVPSDTVAGNDNFESFTWRMKSADGTEFVANTGKNVAYHPSYMYDESSEKLSLYDANDATGKLLLGLHMQYSATAGLEYDPGQSIVNALGQDALHWMTTDTGWSKLMMEQCFQHSNEMEAQGYNVTNLTSPTLYDLTNLFSGTVIVQVTDQHTTSLTITKDVTDAVAGAVQDETYSFTVEKLNADGNTVDNTYTGSVQVKVGNANPRNEQFANGVLTVSCQGENTIQILNLADGTYRVTENTDSMGNVNVNGDTYVWQNETYAAVANAQAGMDSATATINSDAVDTANASVTVTNNYASEQTLTVTKTVGGNMGDTTKDFTFTLQVTGTGGALYTGDLTATKGMKGEQGTVTTLEANEANTYTFDLKHNEQIAIQIPYGYTVTVTEAAVDGYTTKWRNYITGTTVTDDDYPFGTTPGDRTVTMADNYTVDYLNVNDMQVPPSGVDAQNPGISVMLGVAAGSAVLIFGCSFLVWRRRRRDWM